MLSKKLTRDEFIRRLESRDRNDVKLIGDYIKSSEPALFQCTKNECGYEWEVPPNRIMSGQGCPVCANKRLVVGVNSLAVRRPDLVKYFVDPDEAEHIFPGTHKKVALRCPDCGAERTMAAYQLTELGFSCTKCSDFLSIPNKMIRYVMDSFQNNLDVICYEWTPAWANHQRYDVYFEFNDKKYTIEMQGQQHYDPAGWQCYRSLQEIQERDMFKKNEAIAHDIKTIIIDARKSDFDYIFQNINNSLLGGLFDLTIIDVLDFKQKISSNLIKEVCTAFENRGNETLKQIADQFNISRDTVIKYLRIGHELGWCHYISGALTKRAVSVFDENGMEIGRFESQSEARRVLSQQYGKPFRHIVRSCQTGMRCGGLYFSYVSDVA